MGTGILQKAFVIIETDVFQSLKCRNLFFQFFRTAGTVHTFYFKVIDRFFMFIVMMFMIMMFVFMVLMTVTVIMVMMMFMQFFRYDFRFLFFDQLQDCRFYFTFFFICFQNTNAVRIKNLCFFNSFQSSQFPFQPGGAVFTVKTFQFIFQCCHNHFLI